VDRDFEENRTWVQRVADWIAAFSGTLHFLGLHLAWFGIWIVWNLGYNGIDWFVRINWRLGIHGIVRFYWSFWKHWYSWFVGYDGSGWH